MTTPLRTASMKARIHLVAVMDDGTKKTGTLDVDVKEIKTYLTSGGNLISLDGVLDTPLCLDTLPDPTSN
jgi:hypothetical protein